MLRIISSSGREALEALFQRRSRRMGEAEAAVAPILEDVRKRGDQALLRYARELDGLAAPGMRIAAEKLREAERALPPAFLRSVETASQRIRRFAEMQMPASWMKSAGGGIELGQLVRPLEAVAAYIPGGRYPLPSTVMMTVIPAQVAGVGAVSIASPGPSAETLGAASLLGVKDVFHMGGAQAIAAFAFGTETVPKADRIVGPGNIYVAAAKKLLAGEVGIDFVAGPTEILLIFDDGDPRLLAADMLAQAEHDVDAAAILLTTKPALAQAVAGEIEAQLPGLPTRNVAEAAVRNNSAAVVTRTIDEACEIANRFAPEHLAVSESVPLDRIAHAGSVFIGAWSPEAAGDYASGPNHVLPTSGAARLRGGLSVLDYVKIISVQKLSETGLRGIAPAVAALARAEGLEAHARSVEMRTHG